MICAACAHDADQRRTPHDRCPGETWCTCQHLPVRRDEPADETADSITDEENSE